VAAHARAGRSCLMSEVENGHRLARLPPGQNPDGFQVKVREIAARRVAYLRVARPYEGDGVLAACERLTAWARARRCSRPGTGSRLPTARPSFTSACTWPWAEAADPWILIVSRRRHVHKKTVATVSGRTYLQETMDPDRLRLDARR
jgi:hypothetical protein